MRFNLSLIILGICLSLAGCRDENRSSTIPLETDSISLEAAKENVSPDAREYLSNALDTIQAHSAFRDSIDWQKVRYRTFRFAERAKKPSDTYASLRFAMEQIGERHGYLRPPPDTISTNESDPDASAAENHQRPSPSVEIAKELIGGGVGYLRVPAFLYASREQSQQFATHLQGVIRSLDGEDTCGWIVGLRGNGGGNMWPMLAGLGPLLGEGRVGAFVEPDSAAIYWRYRDGQAISDSTVLAEVNGESYEVMNPSNPVAVLTDGRTGSSGEAMLVAFRGQPHVKTFGQSTGGATTAPGYFQLRDGAWLVFSEKCFADRTGAAYCRSIAPDRKVPQSSSKTEGGAVRQAATEWLNSQRSCQSG